jgi:hypothetical protein
MKYTKSLDTAGLGMAGPGEARPGKARQVRHVLTTQNCPGIIPTDMLRAPGRGGR